MIVFAAPHSLVNEKMSQGGVNDLKTLERKITEGNRFTENNYLLLGLKRNVS